MKTREELEIEMTDILEELNKMPGKWRYSLMAYKGDADGNPTNGKHVLPEDTEYIIRREAGTRRD